MRILSSALTSAQVNVDKSPLWKVVLSRASQTTRGYDFQRIIKINRVEEYDSHKTDIILSNADGALTSLDFEHYQAVIASGFKTGTPRTAWIANTAYAVDDIRIPTSANGYQYRCSVAGTSHATNEPTWPTDLGVTVTDGTVTWEMDGNTGDEYSRKAPLRVRVQEEITAGGMSRHILHCIGQANQLTEDKAIDKYTQTEADTQTVKTLITAICNASTNLNSAYNGYSVITVVYDSEDALIDTFKPADYFSIAVNESRWDKITELLAYTRCKARFENDGKLHIFVPRTSGKTWTVGTAYVANDYVQPSTPNNDFTYQCTTAGTSHASVEPTWPTTDGGTVSDGTVTWTARAFRYEYKWDVAGSHFFWSKTTRLRFVNPNKEVVSSPDTHATVYTGNATSTDSYALDPKTHTTYRRLTSNAQATSIAKAIVETYELDAERGIVLVPINVGQELWDYVKATDSLVSDIRIGNVQFIEESIEVHFDGSPPTWRMVISFGKVTVESLMNQLVTTGDGGAQLTLAQIERIATALQDWVITVFNGIQSQILWLMNIVQTVLLPVTPKRVVIGILIEIATTDLTTGDAKNGNYFVIPPYFNNWVIVAVGANVFTAGVTGTTDVQLRNVTDSVDVLSTKVTIDSGEKDSKDAATPPVINATNAVVATGDQLTWDVDAVQSGTAPKGLFCWAALQEA